MAVPDRSIDPRILESAKDEFLRCGFEKASLGSICEKAGVTTGALYKRFKGKDALFSAVVAETIEAMNQVIADKSRLNVSDMTDEQLIKAWDMDEGYMLWWFDFMFRHYDGFVLLLRCAEGSGYSNFQHEWVEKMNHMTYGYYEEAHRRGLAVRDISRPEMHILISSFWTNMYEPFIHGFTWEQIKAHSALVCHLFNWNRTLGFPEE